MWKGGPSPQWWPWWDGLSGDKLNRLGYNPDLSSFPRLRLLKLFFLSSSRDTNTTRVRLRFVLHSASLSKQSPVAAVSRVSPFGAATRLPGSSCIQSLILQFLISVPNQRSESDNIPSAHPLLEAPRRSPPFVCPSNFLAFSCIDQTRVASSDLASEIGGR